MGPNGRRSPLGRHRKEDYAEELVRAVNQLVEHWRVTEADLRDSQFVWERLVIPTHSIANRILRDEEEAWEAAGFAVGLAIIHIISNKLPSYTVEEEMNNKPSIHAGRLFGYVNSCVRHEAVRIKRRRRLDRARQRPLTESVIGSAVGPLPRWVSEIARNVHREVADLSPKLRVVQDMQLRGMSNGQIATALGLTEDTVGSRLYQARKKLKERLVDSWELLGEG